MRIEPAGAKNSRVRSEYEKHISLSVCVLNPISRFFGPIFSAINERIANNKLHLWTLSGSHCLRLFYSFFLWVFRKNNQITSIKHQRRINWNKNAIDRFCNLKLYNLHYSFHPDCLRCVKRPHKNKWPCSRLFVRSILESKTVHWLWA